jgi:hypothetical protein
MSSVIVFPSTPDHEKVWGNLGGPPSKAKYVPGCCARAWWSVKPGVIRPRTVRPSALVENGRGAGGAERRPRSLRGENSEGDAYGRLRRETKPRSSTVPKTAERLRKPESGTGVGLGQPASYGAWSDDVVKRCGNPGKSSPVERPAVWRK